MAKVANARKVFQFIVEVAGVNQFEIQKVTLPEVEIEKVAHGDTNHDIKTAGRIMIGDMTWEKIRPLPQSDRFAWDWLMLAQNQLLGGGQLSLGYKRIVIIKEMDTTGAVAVNRWFCEGVWVTKVSQSDMDRLASDNIVETITLSVDRCYRL
jgi:phage tail-like protein